MNYMKLTFGRINLCLDENNKWEYTVIRIFMLMPIYLFSRSYINNDECKIVDFLLLFHIK